MDADGREQTSVDRSLARSLARETGCLCGSLLSYLASTYWLLNARAPLTGRWQSNETNIIGANACSSPVHSMQAY